MVIWYYFKALERSGLFLWTLRLALAAGQVVLGTVWTTQILNHPGLFPVAVLIGLTASAASLYISAILYWLTVHAAAGAVGWLLGWSSGVAAEARRLEAERREALEAEAAQAGALSLFERDGEGVR